VSTALPTLNLDADGVAEADFRVDFWRDIQSAAKKCVNTWGGDVDAGGVISQRLSNPSPPHRLIFYRSAASLQILAVICYDLNLEDFHIVGSSPEFGSGWEDWAKCTVRPYSAGTASSRHTEGLKLALEKECWPKPKEIVRALC